MAERREEFEILFPQFKFPILQSYVYTLFYVFYNWEERELKSCYYDLAKSEAETCSK